METTRLVLPGPAPTARDAASLCARLARLYEDGARAVECDARAVTAPGLGAVEVLARLRLTARGLTLNDGFISGTSSTRTSDLKVNGDICWNDDCKSSWPPAGVGSFVHVYTSGLPPRLRRDIRSWSGIALRHTPF